MIRERTAKMSLGPLFWTPTIEGLFNYEYLRDNPEQLDDPAWHVGLPPDDHRRHPQVDRASRPAALLPAHAEPPADAGAQVQAAREAGVVHAHRHRQRHPDEVPQQSTWRELDVWVNILGVAADGGDPRRDLLAVGGDEGGQGRRHGDAGQVRRHHRRARRRACATSTCCSASTSSSRRGRATSRRAIPRVTHVVSRTRELRGTSRLAKPRVGRIWLQHPFTPETRRRSRWHRPRGPW